MPYWVPQAVLYSDIKEGVGSALETPSQTGVYTTRKGPERLCEDVPLLATSADSLENTKLADRVARPYSSFQERKIFLGQSVPHLPGDRQYNSQKRDLPPHEHP